MKLPHAELAVVHQDKIVGYFLNSAHRFGASKARFFVGAGFRIDGWERLAQALLDHGRTHEVVRSRETGFGKRYEVEGVLDCPDGRRRIVRTVWQIDEDDIAPRLITAYPSKAA